MKWSVCSTLLAWATQQSVVAFTPPTTSHVPISDGGALYATKLAEEVSAAQASSAVKDRPLLRQFGKGINDRILDASEGYHRFGLASHYTSEETIPCLDMQSSDTEDASCCGDGASMNNNNNNNVSSREEIRETYFADNTEGGGAFGRSSGSGCAMIRLTGKDAASVRGLVDFADDFFDGVDIQGEEDNNEQGIKDVGVIRVANNVHAGFDANVNNEGKMQVLYTKVIPSTNENDSPTMLPFEIGDMVGQRSMDKAHDGMSTLIDIGSQITSAVLGADSASTDKLLDDCTRGGKRESESPLANTVSNSYQRLIRYLEPEPQQLEDEEESNPAFWPHVDSTFLTLIPMTSRPGLEVWCPSSENVHNEKLSERGEWVRPVKPTIDDTNTVGGATEEDEDCVYVYALAGEFLQLLSNGNVPTCIHRVIPPASPPVPSYGFSGKKEKYVPRVSAPLFVRPRRGEDATLDVEADLNTYYDCSSAKKNENNNDNDKGLYFEEGLLEECDGMCVWEYMDCMSPNN